MQTPQNYLNTIKTSFLLCDRISAFFESVKKTTYVSNTQGGFSGAKHIKSTKRSAADLLMYLFLYSSCIFESVSWNGGMASLWKQAGLRHPAGPRSGPHMELHDRLTGPRGLVFTSTGDTWSCSSCSHQFISLRTPCLFQLTRTSASLPAHAIKDSLITMAGSSVWELYLQHL